MAYADQVAGSRRLSIIAGVAAIHGAIGYLFVSGMAMSFVKEFAPVLTITNVPIAPPPPTTQPPPPKPLQKAMPKPATPTATKLPIEGPASTYTVTVDPTAFTIDPAPFEPAATRVEPSPPTPSLATGPKVSGNRAAWFSTDDYPASAIRGEEQGVVAVRLGIGVDGRVTSCAVTAPSGSAALDLATCRLYQKRARFAPARDEVGTPVAATYSDRVVWRLPER